MRWLEYLKAPMYTRLVLDVADLIERYRQAEVIGRSQIPNRAIQAFGLEAFVTVGYPSRIEVADELWRYHDVMQDGRFERNLQLIGGSVDDASLELLKNAISAVVAFSNRRFGFQSAAKDMLSRSFYQYLELCRMLDDKPRPWSILEVGPGSGYLGLLLGLDGHKYVALEASQAFFVYQSALFRDTFGSEYHDGLDARSGARLSHIPWWVLCRESYRLPKLTAATANHMLAEMNKRGLSFVFERLFQSQETGFALIAESLGARIANTYESTVHNIMSQGFDAVEESESLWRFQRTEDAPILREFRPATNIRFGRAVKGAYLRLTKLPLIGGIIKRSRGAVRSIAKRSQREALGAQSRPEVSAVRALFQPHLGYESAEYRFEKGRW